MPFLDTKYEYLQILPANIDLVGAEIEMIDLPKPRKDHGQDF